MHPIVQLEVFRGASERPIANRPQVNNLPHDGLHIIPEEV
jgi:hypothetical protein